MWLVIDTSAEITVALVGAEVLLRVERRDAPRGHVEHLAPMVRRVLAEQVAVADLAGIAVGVGPAPFTGLRIGLATAQTLGLAAQVPVIGVCSLDAVRPLSGVGDGTEQAVFEYPDAHIGVSDARRREVYWAQYRHGVRVGSAQVSAPDAVPVGQAIWFNGTPVYPEFWRQLERGQVDPLTMVNIAQQSSAAGTALPPEPWYLRRPDVHPGGAGRVASDVAAGTEQK